LRGAQTSRDPLTNSSQCRHNSHKREWSSVDNHLVVDKHLERTVRSRFQLNVDTEVATEHCRRTGSLHSDDSISAATYHNAH